MKRLPLVALAACGLVGCGGASEPRAHHDGRPAEVLRSDGAPAHVPSEEQRLESELAGPVDAERTPLAALRLAFLRAGRTAERWVLGDHWGPETEQADPAPAIALLERVVREFPHSAHVGDALLLLGDLERARGDDRAALRAWLAMVCVERARDPLAGDPGTFASERAFDGCTARTESSALRAHAWIRVGELAFEVTPGLDLDVAAEAYRRSIAEPDASAKLRTIARYKRAWALYRSDRYPDALAGFADVAVEDDPQPDLRVEAIQYMAISIAEPDWNADAQNDPVWGLARPEVARWVEPSFPRAADVLRAVAEVWFDETEYERAVGAYAALFARFPGAVTDADRARRTRATERAALAVRGRRGSRREDAR